MQGSQKSVHRHETAFTHVVFPGHKPVRAIKEFLGGVDSEDELPPGIPSATGLAIYWLRASSSACVRGGGAAGTLPNLRASAFFLLAE